MEKSSDIAGIRVLGRLPRSQEKQETVNGTVIFTKLRGTGKKRQTDKGA